jgi:hypothetical protein
MTAAVLAAAPQTGGWFVVAAATITGIGGLSGLAALLLVASQRRKNDAETRKHANDGATVLTNAAVGLIKPLEDRLTRSEADNQSLRSQALAHDRRNRDQGTQLRRQAGELRALRAIIARIRDVVTAPAATADPAATIIVVRDLVASTPDQRSNGS